MDPLLDFPRHVDLITEQSAALVADAEAAGLDARAPSCPGWTAGDVVHHVGVVHRWATAALQGLSPTAMAAAVEAAQRSRPVALLDWFTDGAQALVQAFARAPADLAGRPFLANAPSPRAFWARRQAHETTIHRIDVLAARLGRLPVVAETALDSDHAADGVDELLTGFLPRRSTKLLSQKPLSITLAATDVPAAWTVAVSADPPVTHRAADPNADLTLTAPAAALYLGLWNRGDEMVATGDTRVLGLWREHVRISWS